MVLWCILCGLGVGVGKGEGRRYVFAFVCVFGCFGFVGFFVLSRRCPEAWGVWSGKKWLR